MSTTAETAESKGLFLRIRKVAKEWKEFEDVVLPNGFCHVAAPQRHRLVLKEAILSSEGATGMITTKVTLTNGDTIDGTVNKLNDRRSPGSGKSTPVLHNVAAHTFYLEARDARAVRMQRGPNEVGTYDLATQTYENVPGSFAIEGNTFAPLTMERYTMYRWRTKRATDASNNNESDENGDPVYEIDDSDPVDEQINIRWRIVRQDDAAHFTLNGDDVKSLQFRVVTPEEHSLKWLVDNFYIDEDADLNLEMWFVYERYTPQQQQPQHNANHFVGYYKSAITDQHGV